MYVHLLSNASMDVFPENRLGDFSTVLAQPIKLHEGEWEVGLVDCCVPFSIHMLEQEDAWYEIRYLERSGEERTSGTDPIEKQEESAELINSFEKLEEHQCYIRFVHDHYEVSLPDDRCLIILQESLPGLPRRIFGDKDRIFYGQITTGTLSGPFKIVSTDMMKRVVNKIPMTNFSKVDDIVEAINNHEGNNSIDFQFRFSILSNQMITCRDSYMSGTSRNLIHLSDHLSNVLGFRQQSIQGEIINACHAIDPFPGLNLLLVLTDIVEDSFVGDTFSPVLRALPIQHVGQNEMMSYECFPVIYKKVLRREIESIHVRLVDDVGRRLPFTGRGRVALTLHFKRRNDHGALRTSKNE